MSEDVFFYDEQNECISSISKYHQENCSVGPLAEAHPEVIYFYLELEVTPEKLRDQLSRRVSSGYVYIATVRALMRQTADHMEKMAPYERKE